MQELWWTAALTTGLVGSLHCVGMCGPLAMALPIGRLPHSQRWLAIGLYHIARITAYSGLGLFVGTIGQGLLLAGLQRPVSIGAGIFLLLWMVLKRGKLSGLSTTNRASRWITQPMARFLQSPALSAFAGLGFLNGLLPCGFIYVALTGAIATGQAATGAMYMGLFGLGTVPALLTVRSLPNLFPTALRQKFALFTPLFTIAVALFLLIRGVYMPTTTTDKTGQKIPVCHGATVEATR
jgi:sulfite exporter TauE/SafE